MILRYHRVPQQIFFTHKLVPVTSLLCFCVGVCFLFVSCFCVGLSLALFLRLVFGVSVFVLFNVTKESDYVSVLYQFTFAATTASAPA